MSSTERFAFLLVEDFTHLAFSCAIEPLRIANLLAGRELYRWSLLSANGTEAVSSNRCVTRVDRGLEPLDRDERLVVVSGLGVERRVTPEIRAFLRRERALGRQIGAICSGAYVLAQAGFLDGAEVAVHWAYHDLFAEEFPEVRLCRNVFVTGGRFDTASGGTAAADLMLHVIGQAHGRELATQVADQMVYNAVREGSAQQRVSLQARHGVRNSDLVRATRIMEEAIDSSLRPSDVAAELGISVRQLERLFGRHLGTSPKKYLTELRLQRARNLLVQTERSIAEIAMASGFNTTSNFARVFRARFGTSPMNHRACLT